MIEKPQMAIFAFIQYVAFTNGESVPVEVKDVVNIVNTHGMLILFIVLRCMSFCDMIKHLSLINFSACDLYAVESACFCCLFQC